MIDALGQLSVNQAITATALSTNVVDLTNVTPNLQIGDGEVSCVTVYVKVGAVTAGAETYRFDVVQSATANLATPTVLASLAFIATGVLVNTLLKAGYYFALPIPAGMPIQEFIGMNYTTGGTAPSITISAYFGPWRAHGVSRPQTYKKAYTISG